MRQSAVLFIAAALAMAACSNAAEKAAIQVTPSPAIGLAQSYLAPCSVGAKNEPIEPSSVTMVSRTTGWALASCTLPAGTEDSNCPWPEISVVGILRTTDGGHHWLDVSPPSIADRTWTHTQFFLDATHAWVAEVTHSASACFDQLITFSTSDGGHTWVQGSPISLNTGPTNGVFNLASFASNWLDFVDLEHGWLLVPWFPDAQPDNGVVNDAVLYATSDGGLHWTLTSKNPGASQSGSARGCTRSVFAPEDMKFSSTTDGWLEVDCPATTLLLTHDSGRTWTVAQLPSCICQVYRSAFVDSNHGFMTGDPGLMLTTDDGGASWSQRPVPRGADQVDFADPNHGWALVLEQQVANYDVALFQTADAGASWSRISQLPVPIPNANSRPLLNLQLVDAKTGFVVSIPPPSRQASVRSPDFEMLATTNGGRTWTSVLTQYSNATCTAYGPLGNAPVPVKMTSATTGWAKGGLRTTDGGAHWRDVSPPALRENIPTAFYPPGYTDFYLDGDHAWQAAVYSAQGNCQDHVSTFATADGGRTWKQSAPVQLQIPQDHFFGGAVVDFTNAEVGWLWITLPQQTHSYASNVDAGALYGTSDGGLDWRLVANLSPSTIAGAGACSFSGPITFASPTAGWLSISCTKPAILVTSDGGTTWRFQPLSTAISSPTFFDANRGVALADGPDNAGLLTTSDGGATWHALSLPTTGCNQPASCNGNSPTLDFVDASNFWDFVTALPPKSLTGSMVQLGSLYRSSNGGRSWKLVQANIHLGSTNGSPADVISLVMSDDQHGFIAAQVQGASASVYELLGTSDGGRAWKVINPQIEWAS